MSRPRTQLFVAALLAAAVLTACGKRAQHTAPRDAIEVSATLSTNVIHIGDVVRLHAVVLHPTDGQLTWPVLGSDKAIVPRETRSGSNERVPGRSERSWDLTSLEIGTHPVWTGAVTFARSDGTTLQAELPALSLRVESLLSETNTAPRDIKGLATWPRPGLRVLGLALAVVAGLALIAGLIALVVRRRQRPAATAPPILPHERALRALAALKEQGWIESENVEPFYVELSSIVRLYIEDRFGVRAPEQTTEEFIRAATTSRLLASEHQQLVSAFLEQCDLVKFARYRPLKGDMQGALDAAERLIRETTPATVPAPLQPAATPVNT